MQICVRATSRAHPCVVYRLLIIAISRCASVVKREFILSIYEFAICYSYTKVNFVVNKLLITMFISC